VPHIEVGEADISYYTKLEKRKGEENTIFSIYDEETMSLKGDTNGIKDSVYNFYSKLYTKEEEDAQLQDKFLDQVDVQLEMGEKEALDLPLSENELYEALKSLHDDKSPGPSGLTKEFYMYFWEHLKGIYIACVDEIKQHKELSEMQKRGAIKITHKKGERNLLKN
jgi:hypothetical protein